VDWYARAFGADEFDSSQVFTQQAMFVLQSLASFAMKRKIGGKRSAVINTDNATAEIEPKRGKVQIKSPVASPQVKQALPSLSALPPLSLEGISPFIHCYLFW
jgi:hypothetical protein